MDIGDFNTVVVIGWGKSGRAVVDLGLALGKKVKVSEQRERSCFDSHLIDRSLSAGVEFEFGGHSENFIKGAHLAVLSPGVDTVGSSTVKIITELGILLVAEIEFASWFTKASCIAITGTNGKTTTAHLTYEVLKSKRKGVFLGGNIGVPFSSFVLNTKKDDLVVLEVSSFQLETIMNFRPQLAVLLNLSPDHLDRYKDFGDYLKAKMNIFKNQTKDDLALLNKASSLDFKEETSIKSKIIYFSNEFPDQNLSCVYKIATVYGLTRDDCVPVFSGFRGLAHRRQLVRNINGITFINDSKATNPSSTIWALRNTKGPVVLLAGGKDKGLDYSPLKPYLKSVKKLNLFGEAWKVIQNSLESEVNSQVFSSLDEAVATSFKEAESGDTVLFSPMCSSFDMFSNYKQRGERFTEIVNSL